MFRKRLLRFISSLEFIALASITLYFYAANWGAGFRLIDMSAQQSLSLIIAYSALFISLLSTAALIWKSHQQLLGNMLKTGLIAITIVIVWLLSRDVGIVASFILGFALMQSSDTRIFKSILLSSSLLFSITALLGINILVAGNKIDTGLFAVGGALTQLSALGFTNPNVAYQFFLAILMSALYLYGNRKRTIILLLAVSTALGIITGSMTGFLVAVIACLTFLAVGRRSTGRLTRAVAPYGIIIVTLATFIIGSGILPNHGSVNDALTGRPNFWQLRIENGSYLNIGGNNDSYAVQPAIGESNCEYIGGGNAIWCFPLDNAILYILVHYGVIVLLIYIAIYYRAGKLIRDDKLLAIGLLLLLVFMFERTNFINNIYLLFAVKYAFMYKSPYKEKAK